MSKKGGRGEKGGGFAKDKMEMGEGPLTKIIGG